MINKKNLYGVLCMMMLNPLDGFSSSNSNKDEGKEITKQNRDLRDILDECDLNAFKSYVDHAKQEEIDKIPGKLIDQIRNPMNWGFKQLRKDGGGINVLSENVSNFTDNAFDYLLNTERKGLFPSKDSISWAHNRANDGLSSIANKLREFSREKYPLTSIKK